MDSMHALMDVMQLLDNMIVLSIEVQQLGVHHLGTRLYMNVVTSGMETQHYKACCTTHDYMQVNWS